MVKRNSDSDYLFQRVTCLLKLEISGVHGV